MKAINQLVLGDNLEVLQKMESESVDLVYLDPPFFSNRNYEVIWGDSGEIRSFQDRFSGGIEHYLGWLKERVQEMHRILKPTGSIFLHCDWHADAYIRVFILDKIFGEQNFRNHVTWKRTNAHNDARKKMPNLCDSIFYYSKSDAHAYTTAFGKLDDKYINDNYRFEDSKGKYRLGDLTAPNIRNGESGKEWQSYNPTNAGRSWAVPNLIVEKLVGKERCSEMSVHQKLDLLLENEYISFSKNGIPSVKRYLEDSNGVVIGDLWDDIQNVQSQAKERIGYPTQKPVALLKRIIEMATNAGDVVLDPFVGGGTTVAVADVLQRQWIGIDQSVSAIKVTEFRLNQQQDLFSKPFAIQLHKYDYETLRYKDAFAFEAWIVQQFGGLANAKQRGDLGIDGVLKAPGALVAVPIQVKRSDQVGRNAIDNFYSAIQRYDKNSFEKQKAEGKEVGYLIAFSFGKGATQEVARLKLDENVVIKLVEVADIVPIAKKPSLSVSINETTPPAAATGPKTLEFVAVGQSEAGIEFYAWDFDFDESKGFKPEILIDKTGIQTHKFKAGLHKVAVKVVDNEGLDNMEVIKLKINGGVLRS